MFKPMLFALVVALVLGIGGSFSFGNVNVEGMVAGLIAITCIVIPMSFIILLDKKRAARIS